VISPMSTSLPLRYPCGCSKFDHNAYRPEPPRAFSTPALRHQPGQPLPDRQIRPWLVMFEAGWSIEKIAAAWKEMPETVEAALDIASQQPLPLTRSLPPLPENEAQCTEWRRHLRELAACGRSQKALDRITRGIYSPEFMAELVE
jgi:hypothetical protein